MTFILVNIDDGKHPSLVSLPLHWMSLMIVKHVIIGYSEALSGASFMVYGVSVLSFSVIAY